MSSETSPVYVIGHKNPDTDSICSAVAYAELKNLLHGEDIVQQEPVRQSGDTVCAEFFSGAGSYLCAGCYDRCK